MSATIATHAPQRTILISGFSWPLTFSGQPAVRGAVNGLMGELLENHIRFHLTDGSQEQIAQPWQWTSSIWVRAYLKYPRVS
jgi:hypothetical protein